MDELTTQSLNHQTFIMAAFGIAFTALSGYNLWLHFQRRTLLAQMQALGTPTDRPATIAN